MTNKNSFVIIEPLIYYIKNYTFRIKNVTSLFSIPSIYRVLLHFFELTFFLMFKAKRV